MKRIFMWAIIKNPFGCIECLKGDFYMKRLCKFLPEPIINNAVLQYFKLSDGRSDITHCEGREALALKKAICYELQKKHPSADSATIILFTAVVLRYVMQLSPDAVLYATQGIRGCSDYRVKVDKIREERIKLHYESRLPFVPLLIVVVHQLLQTLEAEIFKGK